MEHVIDIMTILSQFAEVRGRPRAASELAHWSGAEDLLIFAADPDLGALIPAPGFRPTLPGALQWQTFLAEVVKNGRHSGHLPYPTDDHVVSCFGRALNSTAVVAFVGGEPQPPAVESIMRILPLLIATFQAEQKVVNASATTALARNAAKQLREQSTSLEEARRIAHEGLIERRRVEIALEQKAIDLERSNSELQQFATVVSHDLQEPCRMVTSYLTLIEDRSGDVLPEKSRGYLKHALSGATRMAGLIRSLLHYAKVGAEERSFAPVPMEIVVREALDNVSQRIAETKATIHLHDMPSVIGDHVLLVQLIQNFVANALKFVKPGRTPVVTITAERFEQVWRFSLTDEGIGIPAEHQNRIFGVFQRLHAATEYEGTGVGLATCRRIVGIHGGNVGVVSSVGHGSTFWFTLTAGDSFPQA